MKPMSIFMKYPVPAVRTKGVYALASPFSTNDGELLECTSVRTVSDYIANGEDVVKEVFLDNGLTQDDYDEALAENMEIVALVNQGGYIYQVPAKYIQSYPVQDGVLYRPVTITTALPLMPMGKDLDFIMKDIEDLITSRLGVSCKVKIVETATPRAVDIIQSKTIEAARAANISQSGTSYQVIANLRNALDEANSRLQVLERYIVDHNPP